MVFEKVQKMIADRIGCEPAEIKPETKFEELGIDSLDVMELLMLMEDEFGREIELEGQKLTCVAELVTLIETRLGEPA